MCLLLVSLKTKETYMVLKLGLDLMGDLSSVAYGKASLGKNTSHQMKYHVKRNCPIYFHITDEI